MSIHQIETLRFTILISTADNKPVLYVIKTLTRVLMTLLIE